MERRDRQMQIMTLMGNRIDQEHALINSRMTWLMTLNGFLLAIYGVAVTNSDKFASGKAFGIVVIGSSAVGAICNASAIYSHYWASRALKETEQTARWALDDKHIDEDDMKDPAYLFRLFGRDPGAVGSGGPAKSKATHPFWPLHKLMHPWNLLPIVFDVAFVLLPFVELEIKLKGSSYRVPPLMAALPLLLLLLTFVSFLHERLMERRRAG
ncbi:hypothetical protein [Actinoplanes sp. NPDC051494]|uniref:hypothetical protein n=1 Tax=Actinoplanes sp. NPDC051494 TaxID=3363907 RepID=UPI0037B5E523